MATCRHRAHRLLAEPVLVLALALPAATPPVAKAAPAAPAVPAPIHVFDRWAQLVESADVEGLMAHFTDDAVWLSPGEIVSGKPAIALRVAGAFGQTKASNCSLKVDHEQIEGSWANVAVSFTATWTGAAGGSFTELSRYVCVLRRGDDDQWRIWSFTFFPRA